MPNPARRRGSVSSWTDRGFGWLLDQDGVKWFVHLRAFIVPPMRDYVPSGTVLTFEEGVDRDGRPRAIRVVIEDEP